MYNTNENIGSLSNILYSKGLVFAPSEVDMSIRPGWFYHPEEEPHSLQRLFDTYLRSVGGNTTFCLNIPPMPNGKFDQRDVIRLKELGEKLNSAFGKNLAENADISVSPYCGSDTQTVIDIDLKENKRVKYVVFSENIANGQRVESFKIQTMNEQGILCDLYEGTTVGAKKIVPLGEVGLKKIRIFITAARDTPEIINIKVY